MPNRRTITWNRVKDLTCGVYRIVRGRPFIFAPAENGDLLGAIMVLDRPYPKAGYPMYSFGKRLAENTVRQVTDEWIG